MLVSRNPITDSEKTKQFENVLSVKVVFPYYPAQKREVQWKLEKLHDQLLNITTQLATFQNLKEDVKAITSDIAEFKASLQFAHESISKFSEGIDTLETNINQLQNLADNANTAS